jgi:uncharacterized protein
MKIFACTDIHGKTQAVNAIGDALASADLVLIAGDVTHFGGKAALLSVLDEIKKYNGSVLAVPGNCDTAEAGIGLEETGIALHGKRCEVKGVTVAWLGGSLPCPRKTPCEFSEEEFRRVLEGPAFSNVPEGGFVFVTHQPPLGTKLDKAFTGGNVGSTAIRDFIEARKPFLCITGHIHEGKGIDRIGNTLLVNPGPLRHGCYAVIEIEGQSVKNVELVP